MDARMDVNLSKYTDVELRRMLRDAERNQELHRGLLIHGEISRRAKRLVPDTEVS